MFRCVCACVRVCVCVCVRARVRVRLISVGLEGASLWEGALQSQVVYVARRVRAGMHSCTGSTVKNYYQRSVYHCLAVQAAL